MCSIPLGSPRTPQKRSYVHVPLDLGTGVLVHRGDGQQGPTGAWVGAGWVYRVGTTGVYYPAALLGERCRYSEAGPGSPCRGLEWVVSAARALPVMTTLRARSVTLQVPSLSFPPAFQSNGRANPQKPQNHQFYSKVSQNRRVSPKSVNKAYHTPYFQNGLVKSPLEKPRFPFSLAFSPKELMVPKEA